MVDHTHMRLENCQMKIAICDDNSQERMMIMKMIQSIPSTKNTAVSDFYNRNSFYIYNSIHFVEKVKYFVVFVKL